MGFVHLHNRSQYSILDGAMQPGELVSRITELEMGAVALTDTCNLYGAVGVLQGGQRCWAFTPSSVPSLLAVARRAWIPVC